MANPFVSIRLHEGFLIEKAFLNPHNYTFY